MTFPEALSTMIQGETKLRRVYWNAGLFIQARTVAWFDGVQVHCGSHFVMVDKGVSVLWLPTMDDLSSAGWVVYTESHFEAKEQPELDLPETSP